MQLERGIIESDPKVSSGVKNGKNWNRTVIRVNGSTFSGFETYPFKKGDAVAISYEQKGEYKNIKSIMPDGQFKLPTEVVEDKPKRKVMKEILKHDDEGILLAKMAEFEESHDVFATQYAMAYDQKRDMMVYSVMLFYYGN